ncbi:MAG: hypothetical protein JW795_06980 [Chitinivibrionales bacterium]|nr:hypothetical protein [Chitinivibrionales bacterium]
MKIGKFKNNFQRITFEDEAKSRIVQAVPKSRLSSNIAVPRKRRVLQRALLVSLIVVFLAAAVWFLLLPFLGRLFSRTGPLPEFSERYRSLIEIDASAYVYQGNGTLYRLDAVSPLTKIGELNAEELLSDGSDFFYAKSNQVYQIKLDLSGRTRVLRELQPIVLYYVTHDIILYHYGHYRYTLFDRQTGEKRRLFSGSEEKYYFYVAGSGNMAVFVYTCQDYTQKLYAVDLTSGTAIELFDVDGTIRGRVVIINGSVYFLLEGEPVDPIYESARELWSVCLDGKGLMKHDLSSINFESIQSIAGSGQDILIATDENIRVHSGKIYIYRPETGMVMKLEDNIGSIDCLFATKNYYSYYSGQAFAGLIDRNDGQRK